MTTALMTAPALGVDDEPTTLAEAVAVARSIGLSQVGEPVGRAMDSLGRFLRRWQFTALRRDEERVSNVLAALGHNRAILLSHWLAGRADDWPTAMFWERLEDRHRRARQRDLARYL